MKENQRSKNALIQFRFLRDFIKKLEDQVLLLALGLSAIIAVIVMETPQPPNWVPVAFILIFLIAALYSYFKELAQMKSKSNKMSQKRKRLR